MPSTNVGLETELARLLARYAERADTSAVQFGLESPRAGWCWSWAEPAAPRSFFLASATKLYVTALVLQLCDAGTLRLDAPAAGYLPPGILRGVHVLKGIEYSERITLRELLSHTSGIADYFEQKRHDGTTTFGRALQADAGHDFAEVLRITRDELQPTFAPSTPRRARYSDTNFQILGAVLEATSGRPLETLVAERITRPLGLVNTWLFTTSTLDRYDEIATMLYGRRPLVLPRLMASVRADGGLVSSTADSLVFLRAFMRGALFDPAHLSLLQGTFLPVFGPLEYGLGVMRFDLPRYYTLLRKLPPMFGHSGASGTVLFHVPSIDLFVAGAVNQVRNRALVYQLLTRAVMTVERGLAP